MRISVIVLFYNEEGNVDFMLEEIVSVLKGLAGEGEILAVNDGSADGTAERLRKASLKIPGLRIISHAQNLGQSAALWSGLQAATGEIVVTLDGDRQNDFRDVPRLLPFLEQYDAVFGQRVRRQDPWYKLAASRTAHVVRNLFLQDGIKDISCTLKLMKRDTLKYLIPINGFFRFIPFLLKEAGVRYTTADVNHRPRLKGESKYSLLKFYFLSTIADLLFMWWYRQRNLYRYYRFDLQKNK
jgi:dolichol-phosphate mannosyltransferase